MKWGSATSKREAAADAAADAAERARDALAGARPDLACVFASGFGHVELKAVAARLPALTGARTVVGCTAGGVIGGGREIERGPAFGVTLASLPGVDVHSFHLTDDTMPDDDAAPADWERVIGVSPTEVAGFVLMAEPMSDAAARLIAGLDFAYPIAPKVGGFESGGRASDRGRLFHDGRFESRGVIGLALSGDVVMEPAVAQGARPFGAMGVVTKADRHFVQAIDRGPALEFVREQLATLDEADQRRPLGAVCVGLDADPLQERDPDDGDFLIRNLLGADEAAGTLTVGDEIHSGRRVRLFLRDAAASAFDLRDVLRRRLASPPAGALLFSCVGRGAAFYGESDHDSRVFRELAGEVPLGGFFCSGEIGPVGPRTHLHGYTSSFALFRPRSA
jgi:small ligand-binding sensory domain FIST